MSYYKPVYEVCHVCKKKVVVLDVFKYEEGYIDSSYSTKIINICNPCLRRIRDQKEKDKIHY